MIETRYLSNDVNNPTYTFIRIVAYGHLNGEDGWSTVTRFADDLVDLDYNVLPDAVRIQIYDPSGDLVYDTGSGPIPQGESEMVYDFPHEQSWRTFLDGGNVTVHFKD